MGAEERTELAGYEDGSQLTTLTIDVALEHPRERQFEYVQGYQIEKTYRPASGTIRIHDSDHYLPEPDLLPIDGYMQRITPPYFILKDSQSPNPIELSFPMDDFDPELLSGFVEHGLMASSITRTSSG